MSKQHTKISKIMSWALRHSPDEAGITLDLNGWTNLETLRLAIENKSGEPCPNGLIEEIVAASDKQRFIISGDNIRANQGHSVDINLDLQPTTPPAILYHGTKREFLESIMATGLNKGSRQHVHLSVDVETATIVASRRKGENVILTIDTTAMEQPFYRSENGVWLTETVAPEYIKVDDV